MEFSPHGFGGCYFVVTIVIITIRITAVDVAALSVHAFDYISATTEARKVLKIGLVAHTVGSIDGFLLATILLIFSLGLYELFISDIDEAKESGQSSKVLVINSLDDLK
ncbi:YqhA family protein [Isorropodon fossajaponicum symbiont]|uniref:YqhA family protein n=1 Tax=Isorropodon fossajaponicum symbiont TaxID=883811 RepID=UPI00315ADFFE